DICGASLATAGAKRRAAILRLRLGRVSFQSYGNFYFVLAIDANEAHVGLEAKGSLVRVRLWRHPLIGRNKRNPPLARAVGPLAVQVVDAADALLEVAPHAMELCVAPRSREERSRLRLERADLLGHDRELAAATSTRSNSGAI